MKRTKTFEVVASEGPYLIDVDAPIKTGAYRIGVQILQHLGFDTHRDLQVGDRFEITGTMVSRLETKRIPIAIEDEVPTPISPQEHLCTTCDHCGMDMDMDPYCVHPAVLVQHSHGLVTRRALPLFCGGEEHQLWTPRKPR